jgi:hypothetical protein
VDLVLILLLVGVAVAGAFAVAAALAAGSSDRMVEGTEPERIAIWEAGHSPHDLRVLAGLAAHARVQMAAAEVEVVLRRAGDGVVVTGCRLPPGRLGAPVPYGEGVAGRSLVARQTAVVEVGEAALTAVAVPIGPVGVLAVTVGERPLRPADVARLEALAADAAARLDSRPADIRDAG